MTDDPYSLAESIHVAASPQQVYDVVSDVRRTGEWSPIVDRCEWDGDDPTHPPGPQVGATFTGYNIKPERQWQTTNQVVVAEPGRAFVWEVAGGLVRWGYELEPDGDGTRLTETWTFGENGRTAFHERYGDTADDEIAIRLADAQAGVPATLAAIRRVVEG